MSPMQIWIRRASGISSPSLPTRKPVVHTDESYTSMSRSSISCRIQSYSTFDVFAFISWHWFETAAAVLSFYGQPRIASLADQALKDNDAWTRANRSPKRTSKIDQCSTSTSRRWNSIGREKEAFLSSCPHSLLQLAGSTFPHWRIGSVPPAPCKMKNSDVCKHPGPSRYRDDAVRSRTVPFYHVWVMR